MRKTLAFLVPAVVALLSSTLMSGGSHSSASKPEFQTSDRCLACHNGLTTPTGQDVSIGLDWRASIMANSSRDPYWQASVRRETIDHPESKSALEDECSVCHMPITRYEAKLQSRPGEVFAFLPFNQKKAPAAEDGVSCSVCHQIGKDKLGTRESFNGEFVVDTPKSSNDHPEYGPFPIAPGNQRIMNSSRAASNPRMPNTSATPQYAAPATSFTQPPVDPAAKKSAISRSRCRISSGCTATIPPRAHARSVTCLRSMD